MPKKLGAGWYRDTKTMLLRQMPDRRYFRGISRYLHERREWTLLTLPYDQPALVPDDVPRWADAVILDLWSPRLRTLAEKFRVPVVNLIETIEPLPYPTVCGDNFEAGRLAFEHFRSLGLTHFAYLEWGEVDGPVRRRGFEQAAAAAGMTDRLIEIPSLLSRSDWSQDVARQADIFREMPRPIGILCFADWLAVLALQALHIAGLEVPNEVAVMGVGDDEILCESCLPSLSSVNTHNDRIGYEAARLAIALSEGGPAPETPHRVRPLGVIERMSTQVMATDDHDVAEALRHIHHHLAEGTGLTAQRVAELVIVSRRGLDEKFKRIVGRTVAEEIARQRMRSVLHLLQTTDLKMVEIAARSGFKTISHMSRAVSQETGRPPRDYRRWAKSE
ncbi:MAG: substrate-binding domain-containing protein [Planctomycetota bacterium]